VEIVLDRAVENGDLVRAGVESRHGGAIGILEGDREAGADLRPERDLLRARGGAGQERSGGDQGDGE
jgi:hypothetical protein